MKTRINHASLVRICTLAFIISFFSSCATLMSGRSSKVVYINSDPQGAEVYRSMDKALLGNTPLSLQIVTQSDMEVEVRKEGYVSAKHRFATDTKNGFLLLDVMLLCIPCIVDFNNGSLDRIAEPNHTAVLRKAPEKREQVLGFRLAEPVFDLQRDSYIGMYQKEKMYFKLNDHVIGSRKLIRTILCDGSQQNFIRFTDCRQENNEKLFGNTSIGTSSYILKPVVHSLNVDIKTARGKDFGNGQMETEWQLIDGRSENRVVSSFFVFSQASFAPKLTRNIVDSLFKEAYYGLLDNDSFYNALRGIVNDKSIAGSEKNKQILPRPVPPVFEKTKDIVRYAMQAVVTIEHDEGFGSGFFVSSDGYLITSNHVVEGKTKVKVKLNGGITLDATVVRSQRETDIALLKVEGKDFKALVMGNSDTLELGEDVLAIGTPNSQELAQSITKGVVSGKRKVDDIELIQTDVSLNEGNSGGPLLNEQGEVVGIIMMKLVGRGVEGLGFCVPMNKARDMLGIGY